MNVQLMIDTLSMITQKSQNNIQQMIRKNKQFVQKQRYIKLYMRQMKSQIYEWLITIIKSINKSNSIIQKLINLKNSNDQQLYKNRLHILLKKKLNKLKKQSFLYSIDSNQNNYQQDSKLQQLQKSIIHIEKDLNIYQQEQTNFGIQSIIQKSRMINLQFSHIKHYDSNAKQEMNHSTISQYEVFKLNQSQKKNYLIQPIKDLNSNLSKLTPFGINKENSDAQQQKTITSRYKQQMKQNQQINSFYNQQKTNESKQVQIKNIQSKLLNNNQLKIQNSQSKNQPQIPKTMKKKKKSIYTNMGNTNNLSKQDLFGNILQQSYQTCLQNQNK